MELIASTVNSLISKIAIFAALAVLMSTTLAQTAAIQRTVEADGHPMALWEKSVAQPRGHILLHHGRTWSSILDFDLQVSGVDLSLMDGFNNMGYSVWALDARGYGETPEIAVGDMPGGDHAALLETPRAKSIKSTTDFME